MKFSNFSNTISDFNGNKAKFLEEAKAYLVDILYHLGSNYRHRIEVIHGLRMDSGTVIARVYTSTNTVEVRIRASILETMVDRPDGIMVEFRKEDTKVKLDASSDSMENAGRIKTLL